MTEAATPITHPDRVGHAGRGGSGGSPCADIVHDPQALLDDTVPLDRAVHERLVDTVLTWRENSTVLPSADLDQITLQLTGYGRLLIRETKTACGHLPQTDPAVPLARASCAEAVRRFDTAHHPRDPLTAAQSTARLVRTLHTALDRALAARPTPAPKP
ncbi:DUF6415 family natural product biosynthesis protein [Streptomyces sp. NPDC033754]|uniref:DUF6415 family natural product biosynthesis protein n=1 Tax=unclassified Streptomyces TaxID=2593676 RepID=UPI0034046384